MEGGLNGRASITSAAPDVVTVVYSECFYRIAEGAAGPMFGFALLTPARPFRDYAASASRLASYAAATASPFHVAVMLRAPGSVLRLSDHSSARLFHFGPFLLFCWPTRSL
jgi:hypothetical protein